MLNCNDYLDGVTLYTPDEWNCLEVELIIPDMIKTLASKPWDEEIAKRFCTFVNNLHDCQMIPCLRLMFLMKNANQLAPEYAEYYCNHHFEDFKKQMETLVGRINGLGITQANAAVMIPKIVGVKVKRWIKKLFVK